MDKSIKQEYRKMMTRPLDLIGCECWDVGERIEMPKHFHNLLAYDPLFIYRPGMAVTAYYNFTDPKQDSGILLEYLENADELLRKEKEKFDDSCRKIRDFLQSDSKDYRTLYDLILSIWSLVSIAQIFGDLEEYQISKKLKQFCVEVRKSSDDVLHAGWFYLSDLIRKALPESIESHGQFVTISEFLENRLPSVAELNERSSGYLYHRGKIYFDTDKYLKEHNFYLTEIEALENIKEISGNVACKGLARGIVRLVFEMQDLEKVNVGDIMISPMTTPEMLPAMKKAAAFVTDEGGITCHAAIVAREMGKPCIIGTKIATQVLRDGDLVEVDADNGIVKIL